MTTKYKTTAYRYPHERLILGMTIIVVLGVIIFTAAATACLSVLFVLGFLLVGYYSSKSHHRDLIRSAQQINQITYPELSELIKDCAERLQVEPTHVYILPNRTNNAYTFGMDTPKTIVLYSSLLQLMDRDELQFIVGHEMGHICLGHTWLNSLVGGMAGIPSNITSAILMHLAFLWWNRACEFSADRAGMLACGRPSKAISALVKLEVGSSALNSESMAYTIQRIKRDDDDFLDDLGEALATHPVIARRIEEIRKYASSTEYKKLQLLVDQNLT